jgi:hypothetical protein
MYYISAILVPTEREAKIMGGESSDNNIWEPSSWKRSLFTFICLELIFYYMLVVSFTASTFFPENIWGLLVMLKIFQITWEIILEEVELHYFFFSYII